MTDEFYEINKDIFENKEFNKLKNYKHHGITRYEHSINVSYLTYKVTRKICKNYKEITRAALLHDFFTDEVEEVNSLKKLINHPKYALENAKKSFNISKLQEDIILSHMFPIGIRIPKYKESWIVDLIDDYVAVCERGCSFKQEISAAVTFLFLIIISNIK